MTYASHQLYTYSGDSGPGEPPRDFRSSRAVGSSVVDPTPRLRGPKLHTKNVTTTNCSRLWKDLVGDASFDLKRIYASKPRGLESRLVAH